MMFNKGATNATMATPGIANQVAAQSAPMADPWNNMRSTTPQLSIDPAKRDQMFQGMMGHDGTAAAAGTVFAGTVRRRRKPAGACAIYRLASRKGLNHGLRHHEHVRTSGT